MTIHISRPAAALLSVVVLTGATWLAWSASEAEAARGTTVVCAHVPQSATQVDEAAVAKFMSEQLVEGRTRFQTIRGISTVICSY